MSNNSDRIRSMANLLRSGATLTDLSCPACSSPIFRLTSGELWCVQCQKKVVKEKEQIKEVKDLITFNAIESTLLMKIQKINERMRIEDDMEELKRLSAVMSALLENLDKVKKIGQDRT